MIKTVGKRIVRNLRPVGKKQKPRVSPQSILPSEPTQSKIDPATLVILLIATPKWGKTKFGMSNPKALLFAFEEGHKFQRGYKIRIAKWDDKHGYAINKDDEGVTTCTAMQAIEALEQDDSDKFNMVIIDTADMAVKMCADFHCEMGGVDHPSDLGDYGKGWDTAINTPWRRFVMRILKTGRGVMFITHSKNEIARFTTGEKARKEMTLGKGPRSLCESQADIIMHGEIGKKRAGMKQRDRILVTEGDLDTLAGNRTNSQIPERFIVNPDQPWKQFVSFFNDPKAATRAELEYKKHARVGNKND